MSTYLVQTWSPTECMARGSSAVGYGEAQASNLGPVLGRWLVLPWNLQFYRGHPLDTPQGILKLCVGGKGF